MKFKDTKYGDLTNKIFVGDIMVVGLGLTSLEGAPKALINGSFDCSYNKLKSLKYSPKIIRGNFNCSLNQLTKLEFSPKEVDGYYMCYDNQLTSLSGIPNELKSGFFCGKNQLTSFEYSPKKINGNFNASSNKIRSIKNAPLEIKGIFYCKDNPNPYLEEEYETKQKYPNLSDDDFNVKMYEITKYEEYLSQSVKDIFLF